MSKSPGTYHNPVIEECLADGVKLSPFPLDAPLFSSPTFTIPYEEADGSEALARFTMRARVGNAEVVGLVAGVEVGISFRRLAGLDDQRGATS